MGKQNESIKFWNNTCGAQPIIIKIIGQSFWSWQSLPTTTQCIHQPNKHLYLQIMVCTPSLTFQGVHKIMNPIVKDQAMWLVDIQAQIVLNLEEA
jgi:hypothetical protein